MAQSSVWIALALSAAVICSDTYARRVPNKALILALCLGAAFYLQGSMTGQSVWATATAGLLTGLLALLPFYLVGWMGAGDVKYFACLGFLLGPAALLPIWLASALLLGIHSFVALAHRSRLPLNVYAGTSMLRWQQSATLKRITTGMRCARQGRKGAPYAAYLGISTCVVLLGGMPDV